MRRRNRLIFTGVCALAFGLAACGSSDENATSSPDDASAPLDGGHVIDSGPTLLDASDGAVTCIGPSGYSGGAVRGGGTDILPLTGYDYAPSIIVNASGYRAWWCGANPAGGDEIRYAEATSLDGPWHAHSSAAPNTFDVALTAGGNGTAFFDTTDTCDPSVVQAPSGVYYMYYGGNGAPFTGAPNNTTQIGVASSATGLPGSWTKLNSENPIVTPFKNGGASDYGAGQPSVVVVDSHFFMVYTDTSGANGPGLYVIKAQLTDPLFNGPDVVTFNGFGMVPLTAATKTSHRISTDTNGDWYFSDAAEGFVLATNRTFSSIHAAVLTNDGFTETSGVDIASGGNADGPGIVRTADGHAPVTTTCGILPVDLLRADCYASAGDTTDCALDPYGNAGANINLWDLAHVGIDLDIHEPCACVRVDPTDWPSVSIDTPTAATVIGNSVLVGGWALDNTTRVGSAIDPTSLAVNVDGVLVGRATYGGSRPDVCNVYPGRVGCPNVGFNYTLDTSKLAAGEHTITVSASNTDLLPISGLKSVVITR